MGVPRGFPLFSLFLLLLTPLTPKRTCLHQTHTLTDVSYDEIEIDLTKEPMEETSKSRRLLYTYTLPPFLFVIPAVYLSTRQNKSRKI